MTTTSRRVKTALGLLAIIALASIVAAVFRNAPESVYTEVRHSGSVTTHKGEESEISPSTSPELEDVVDDGITRLSYSPPPPQVPSTPETQTQPPSRVPSAEWITQYEKSTVAELGDERDALLKAIDVESTPELLKRFEAGVSEHVSMDRTYNATPEDFRVISGIYMIPNRGTFRMVLPREEFPDLYEMKDKANWLNDLMVNRSREKVVFGATPFRSR